MHVHAYAKESIASNNIETKAKINTLLNTQNKIVLLDGDGNFKIVVIFFKQIINKFMFFGFRKAI